MKIVIELDGKDIQAEIAQMIRVFGLPMVKQDFGPSPLAAKIQEVKKAAKANLGQETPPQPRPNSAEGIQPAKRGRPEGSKNRKNEEPAAMVAPWFPPAEEQVVTPAKKPAPINDPIDPPPATASKADAEAALNGLFEAKGLQAALDLLSRYGAKIFPDLPYARYEAFTAEARQIAAA